MALRAHGYTRAVRVLLPPADQVLPSATTGGAPAQAQGMEPYDFYRPAEPHAPWLRINMVASVDGLATDAEGLSGGLGGPADLRAYRAQRALADCILVGAGTLRAEGMGPHVVHASVAERRREDGRDSPAVMAVVSRSLDLDPQARVFSEARVPTVVVTCPAAPADRRERLAQVAHVVVAGDETVDLVAAVAQLRALGLPHVLSEGGPRLNADLLRAGVVDELCLTVAPRLLAADGRRIVAAADGAGVDLRPSGVAEEDGELFLRYAVAQPPADGVRGGAR